jgi:hypothetical protein
MNDSPVTARTRITYAVAAAGALFTLALMLYASQPWSADGAGGGGALLLVPFALAALSPYAILAWLANRARAGTLASWAVLVIAVLITVPAIWIYVLGFIVEPDAQSGLLFVFIPIYQYLVGGAGLIVTAIARAVLGKR